MTDLPDLLTLPLDTITILAAGYLGYRVAYTGKDTGHGAMDTLFMSLVFALVAKLVLQGLAMLAVPLMVAIPFAVCLAIFVASGWRKWGQHLTFAALRGAGVSTSDRHRTAWDTIRTDARLRPSQLILRRKDGVSLMCDNLGQFADHFPGCCVLGSDGSVALFVTHQSGPEDKDWEAMDVDHADWGALLTYIPAAEIAGLHIRC